SQSHAVFDFHARSDADRPANIDVRRARSTSISMSPQSTAKVSSKNPDVSCRTRWSMVDGRTAVLLSDLFQVTGGGVDERGLAIERPGHPQHFSFSFGVMLLLDAFADAGHRLHCIAGVEAGCVQKMAVPRAARQAGRIG